MLAALLLVCAPGSSAAQGLDQSCQLSLARLDNTTTNTLLLETNATYWIASYQALPGTRIRIEGEFPYSRYTSWNVYDTRARPADAIADFRLRPDAGSFNPFLPGADRTRRPRRYELLVNFSAKPRSPPRNNLYAGRDEDGNPNFAGLLVLRVYIPDRGRDRKGGVPLPRVTLEPAAGSGPALPTDACRRFQAPYPPVIDDAVRSSEGTPDVTGQSTAFPGRSPPVWTKFTNFSEAFTEVLLNNQTGEGFQDEADRLPTNRSGSAGIFANKDISYVFTGTSQGFGRVLVVRGRAPTFPNTRPPARFFPTGKQLRYWSFCQYEPASQRVIDCRSDDRIAVNRQGFYTVVVSTPRNRPSNARAGCGVTWIPWGPFKQGLLIYRHMLAASSFRQAVQRVPEPGEEKRVMREYYPSGRYLSGKSAFERRGCAGASGRGGAGAGEDGGEGGDGSGAGDDSSTAASAGRTAGTGADGGELPFSGLALAPLLAAGAALAAAGLALRQLAG